MTEQVKVTQADREAFAALCLQRWVNAHGTELEWMKQETIRIVNGSADRDITALTLARHRIAAQAELLEALEDAERGLLAITVALAEQDFSTVAQKVGAYAERAGAAIAKAKGEA